MSARIAVVELFRTDLEWRRLFSKSCREGSARLRAIAHQVRDELAERGQRFTLEEIEDALLYLAREKLPESPGARWDCEWAEAQCRGAMDRLQAQYRTLSERQRRRLDLSRPASPEVRMLAAGESNDPAEFRHALQGWQLVSLAAMHDVTDGKGAA
jgi:hypothetical protein